LLKLWPNLTLQFEIIGCGIIDKTMMCEAAVHSGMKPAIWVKYRLSFFHNNYSDKYCIAWMKNKAENPVSHWIIKKNNEKEKSNL
jgi:hypothetical protein